MAGQARVAAGGCRRARAREAGAAGGGGGEREVGGEKGSRVWGEIKSCDLFARISNTGSWKIGFLQKERPGQNTFMN